MTGQHPRDVLGHIRDLAGTLCVSSSFISCT